ncbi:MAG: YceI family protein [Oligoflexia bacterium]|nr:YceI family protein [Oligoflexia bacterium]
MPRSRTVLATLATLVALGGLSLPAAAAFHVDGKPKVSFYAEGSPGALDIEGKTSDLSLTDDGTTVTAVVDLENLSTGIDLRDDHMKEKYMEVGTYPTASVRFARADLQLPTQTGKSTNGTLAATFNCHGVDQPATVTYTVKKSKTGYAVDASFAYNADHHGIVIPSYLGITVDPAQKARVRFSMVDE